jgi:ParB family transcriptional regulator, chromosome partitioning protein
MAFAITDDIERQEEVFASMPKHRLDAHSVRKALVTDEVPSTDRLARFVGTKSYEKAGGGVRVDLFSDAKTVYLQDSALLRRLGQEKLDKKAEQIKDEDGAAWALAILEFDYSDRAAFGRIGMIRKNPSAKEAVQIAKLEAELKDLHSQESEASDEGSYERIEVIEEKLAAIEQSLERPDPRAVKLAGIVVTVATDGRIEVERGLIRPEDKKALKALAKDNQVVAGESIGGDEDGSACLSGALRLNLTSHFTAALRARLDVSPSVALRALTAALWSSSISELRADEHSPVTVRGSVPILRSNAPEIDGSNAVKAYAESRLAWESKLDKVENLLAWLSAQPDAEVIALLGHCTAGFVSAVSQQSPDATTLAIAAAAGLQMADYWQATTESFFKRVPKAVILDALRESDPTLDLAPFEKAKKAELMGMAEPILAKAKWLPGMLRMEQGETTQ